MNKNPLVSVFIPSYNAENYIEECVLSVIEQDYKNIELVISDDASTDGTPLVLAKLKDRFPDRIKLFLQEENLGITKNCNFLLNKCKGQYILFTAGDDMLTKESISKSLEPFFKFENLAIVISKNIKIDQYSKILKSKEIDVKSHVGNLEEILRRGFFDLNGMLVKRSYIPIDGYREDLKFASDFDFIPRILKKERTYYYLNEKLSYYRKHSSSITSSEKNITFKDNLKGYLFLLEEYPEYSNYICELISNLYRGVRKNSELGYYNSLKNSIVFNIFNVKTIFALLIYLITFKKYKL